MINIWALFQKEFRSYFVSPIAYGMIAGFLVVTGFFFYVSLSFFLDVSVRTMMEAQMYRQAPPPINVNTMVIRPLFGNFAFLILLMLSMITMRLLSEEKKMMTIELLITSPITTMQLVIGKFLAGFSLYVIMLLPTSIYFLILSWYGNPEIYPIITGYVGLLLMGAVFVGIGLLISSFTENQLIAVAVSFSVFILLWVINWPAQFISQPIVSAILNYVAIPVHFDDFTKGVFDTKHIFYFLSIIALSLFLTYRSLESMKWRS